jgi:4-amino-4-deoxy-L-arabinose transferase-like glycosyltransferase
MLTSPDWHGWVIPRIQDRLRLNKPPAIYWAQAASASLFAGAGPGAESRDAIWMYRIPSILGGILAVLCTWRLGLRLFDPRAAFLAAALLATLPILLWEARQARSDMLLLGVTTLSLWLTHRVIAPRRPSPPTLPSILALWLAVGVGVLVKGPVTPMIVFLTLGGMCLCARSWKPLRTARPLLGLIIIIACVAPWVALVAGEVGFSNYAKLVFDETIGRSLEPAEGHWGPPGYHLLLAPALLMPATLGVGLALSRLWRRRRAALEPAPRPFLSRLLALLPSGGPEAFLLSVILPSWIIFELVSTKLPHYTLPLYPAVVLLCARASLSAAALNPPRLLRAGVILWILGLLAYAGALAASSAWVALHLTPGARGIVISSVLALLVLLLITLVARVRRRPALALLIAIAGLALISRLFFTITPRLPDIRTSVRLADAIRQVDPSFSRPIAALGYHEDSLIFETLGRVKRLQPAELPAFLASSQHPLLIAPRGDPALTGSRELAGIVGFNYSRGRRVDLVLAEPLP